MRKAIIIMFTAVCAYNLSAQVSGTVKDIEGNEYPTVTIGDQVWMAENLKTTKLSDGTRLLLITDNEEWSNTISPGYCWNNHDEARYKNSCGALYNWYAVGTGKLCPEGWHVPSDAEWSALTEHLGGKTVAGGKLKSKNSASGEHPKWNNPNTGATDDTGFAALPCGYRANNQGRVGFTGIGKYGSFWSSTASSPGVAWYRLLSCEHAHTGRMTINKRDGNSVRCIKD
jgi:uncharacterized protein (TIGR02145 family)